jgi:uncharacterized membrane protein
MRDLAGHIARRRRRRAKLAVAFTTGLALGLLVALISRALADERAGLAPFAFHAIRHVMVIGLLAGAAALVAVAILRSARR